MSPDYTVTTVMSTPLPPVRWVSEDVIARHAPMSYASRVEPLVRKASPVAKIRTTKQVPLSEIQTHPENYNHGDAGAISISLQENGQYRAIVVSEATGNILAGNHTYLAAQMNGEKKILAHLIPDLTPEDEIRILIADNQYAKLAYTDDNLLSELLEDLQKNTEKGLLATGWDEQDLDRLFADLYPKATFERDEDGKYTRRVESPIYEPTGPEPPISALYQPAKTDELIRDIEKADLPDDLRAFLTAAAQRHTVLNFDQIANYYAHASPEIQRLMEASALVIIDFDQAIEHGFVSLTEDIESLFRDEYPDA